MFKFSLFKSSRTKKEHNLVSERIKCFLHALQKQTQYIHRTGSPKQLAQDNSFDIVDGYIDRDENNSESDYENAPRTRKNTFSSQMSSEEFLQMPDTSSQQLDNISLLSDHTESSHLEEESIDYRTKHKNTKDTQKKDKTPKHHTPSIQTLKTKKDKTSQDLYRSQKSIPEHLQTEQKNLVRDPFLFCDDKADLVSADKTYKIPFFQYVVSQLQKLKESQSKELVLQFQDSTKKDYDISIKAEYKDILHHLYQQTKDHKVISSFWGAYVFDFMGMLIKDGLECGLDDGCLIDFIDMLFKRRDGIINDYKSILVFLLQELKCTTSLAEAQIIQNAMHFVLNKTKIKEMAEKTGAIPFFVDERHYSEKGIWCDKEISDITNLFTLFLDNPNRFDKCKKNKKQYEEDEEFEEFEDRQSAAVSEIRDILNDAYCSLKNTIFAFLETDSCVHPPQEEKIKKIKNEILIELLEQEGLVFSVKEMLLLLQFIKHSAMGDDLKQEIIEHIQQQALNPDPKQEQEQKTFSFSYSTEERGYRNKTCEFYEEGYKRNMHKPFLSLKDVRKVPFYKFGEFLQYDCSWAKPYSKSSAVKIGAGIGDRPRATASAPYFGHAEPSTSGIYANNVTMNIAHSDEGIMHFDDDMAQGSLEKKNLTREDQNDLWETKKNDLVEEKRDKSQRAKEDDLNKKRNDILIQSKPNTLLHVAEINKIEAHEHILTTTV